MKKRVLRLNKSRKAALRVFHGLVTAVQTSTELYATHQIDIDMKTRAREKLVNFFKENMR